VLGEVQIPQQGGGDGAAATEPSSSGGGSGDCSSVSIAWRGDGRFFATSTAAPGGGPRRIHIWEREGCQLHAAAEAQPGLAPPLAWQPNGRHLYAAGAVPPADAAAAHEGIAGVFAAATAARLRAAGRGAGGRGGAGGDSAAALPLQQRVVLFERNGLKHGGFDLPGDVPCSGGGGSSGDSETSSSSGSGAVVRDLQWSPDSELLAVVLGPPEGAGDHSGSGGGWRVQVRARATAASGSHHQYASEP
jgi:elongator complex protein 1